MEPLSLRVRRSYMIGFTLLWVLLIPAVLLYADGWRFREGFGFVRTGGIFVSVPYTEAHVSINGKLVGTSSFLNRGLYLNDLAPSSYVLTVEKDGYRTWSRTLVVEPQVVSDVRALLIPDTLEIVPLSTRPISTSTRSISKETKAAYLSVFSAHTVASSTVPVSVSDSIGLFINQGTLSAQWMKEEYPQSIFCGRPSFCVKEIPIERTSTVTRAVFYKGGVVYRTVEGDIYFTELDVRATPITIKIFSGVEDDFSVIDGNLILKQGSSLYQVDSL